MLAIGRALMARPRVLLLDEPSMGLAPMVISQIFRIISEINAQGTTVLLVEQNAQQALSRSDRAYILETGSVTRSGPARELLADDSIPGRLPRRGVTVGAGSQGRDHRCSSGVSPRNPIQGGQCDRDVDERITVQIHGRVVSVSRHGSTTSSPARWRPPSSRRSAGNTRRTRAEVVRRFGAAAGADEGEVAEPGCECDQEGRCKHREVRDAGEPVEADHHLDE